MKEQTRVKMEKVKAAMERGLSMTQACKKHGLSYNTYKVHSEETPKRRRRSTVVTVPIAPKAPSRMAAVIGSPLDIAKFLEEYNG